MIDNDIHLAARFVRKIDGLLKSAHDCHAIVNRDGIAKISPRCIERSGYVEPIEFYAGRHIKQLGAASLIVSVGADNGDISFGRYGYSELGAARHSGGRQ